MSGCETRGRRKTPNGSVDVKKKEQKRQNESKESQTTELCLQQDGVGEKKDFDEENETNT